MWIKNSLYKSIFKLLGINGFSYLVMFLSSVIIFRTVDKSYYGLYVIMLSLFAITELMMAGLNDCIVRFLNDKISLKEKQSIVFFVLLYKYFLISIFIVCAYLGRKYGFLEFLIGNYNEVSSVVNSFLFVVILNGLLSNFISINNSILNSQKEYKYTAKVEFFRNIVSLIVVFTLSFFTTNYLHYLYSGIVISLFLLIFLASRISRYFNSFSLIEVIKAKTNLEVAKKYILPYSAPLTGSSILTYVKNNLPILILGKEFSLEGVAVFSILKTFFKALHSVSGSFVNPMMSKFLELKNHGDEFFKNLNTIYFGILFLRTSLYLVFLFLVDYLFLLYKLSNSEANKFIFFVLGLEYVVAGLSSIYGIILRLEGNTRKVLNVSLVRFTVELVLLYFLLLKYGIMGAALVLLIARYVEILVSYLYVRNLKLFPYSWLFLVLFFLAIIYYFNKMQLIQLPIYL